MNIKTYTAGKNIFFFTAIFFSLVILTSCAQKMSFQTSSVVPAAQGNVKVKKDNNNNYHINLSVKRLANPNRLSPSKNVYVVWMNSAGNVAKNIGQIKTSSGILSNTLKSSLNTVSTNKPTDFFITAENDGNIEYPSGEVVLRTQ